MTMLEFERLVDEGIITIGDLPLRSVAPDIGKKPGRSLTYCTKRNENSWTEPSVRGAHALLTR